MISSQLNEINNDLFNSDYIPEKCPHRDEIIDDIITLLTLNERRLPTRLLLVGSAGSGKTLVARKVCASLLKENKNNNYTTYVQYIRK